MKEKARIIEDLKEEIYAAMQKREAVISALFDAESKLRKLRKRLERLEGGK